jgi:KipI family sensor histidine kinase inhibitor
MLGFLPGFAYLGGLPAALEMPRLATPRTRVPAGSLAIAGRMAAIYPWDSPGGWRLVGRTGGAVRCRQRHPPGPAGAGRPGALPGRGQPRRGGRGVPELP